MEVKNLASSYEILLKIGGALDGSLPKSLSSVSKSLQGMDKTAAKSSSSLGSINGVAGKASSGLSSLAKAAIGLGGVLGVSLGFKSMIDAASATQDANSQLQAVLKSTGGAAGVTQQAAENLASSLGNVTTFGRNATLGTENLLLTFTQIGKNVMPQATEAALDMATSLKEDTTSAAMQLGKALNDPVAGVTALQRVGVKLTEQQKNQVKSMVAVGNVAGAQAVILKELGTEFGGSAKAAGQTFSGQMAIAKNAVTGAMGEIGDGLLPVIQSILPKLTDGVRGFANFVTNHQGDIKKAVESIGPFFSKIGNIVETVVMPTFQKMSDFIKAEVVPRFQNIMYIVKDIAEKYFPSFGTSGTGLLTNLENLTKNGLNIVIGALKFVRDNSDLVKAAVELAGGAWLVYKGYVIASAIATEAMAIKANIMTIATEAMAIKTNVMTIATKAWAAAQWLFNVALDANPIGIVIVAIGLLVAAGVALYMNWAKVKQTLSDTWVSIKNSFIGGVNVVIDLLNKLRGVIGMPMIAKVGLDVSSNSTSDGMKAAHNALGTDNWRGGLTWVGEKGPELINLAKGAQVIPNNKLGNIGSELPGITQMVKASNVSNVSNISNMTNGGDQGKTDGIMAGIGSMLSNIAQMINTQDIPKTSNISSISNTFNNSTQSQPGTGVSGGTRNGGGIVNNFNHNPVYNIPAGTSTQEIKQIVSNAQREFEQRMTEWQRNQKRVSFA